VTATVLVADDDAVARDLLVEVLSREGYHVLSAADGNEAIKASQSAVIDLALIDLRMPGLDGLELLHRLTRTVPDVVVIILTAFATMDTTIATIRAGAYDYLSKPFRMEEIKLVVRRGLEARRLERENRQYRAELKERYRVDNLVGQSAPMIGVYKLIARVAALDTTVLVLGETGTGKEVVARSIHYASPRSHHPFVVVDCTSLPDTLFESELFGHTRGAFTGAVATRRGLLEAAEGGTVLIDEIGDLSAPLQAKLLRVLQERAVRRVGDNESVPIDVRIIAATNRDLKQRVVAGAFREDLYYRLNVVTITVPPLRERLDDLPLLAQHFLQKHARAASKPVKGFARETLAALTRYPWPGNVRELEHTIERAVALASTSVLIPDDLPLDVRGSSSVPDAWPERPKTLEELKSWYVDTILRQTRGNKAQAAEILGIDRRTLYRMLERSATDEDLDEP
jgi:two-component system, NtrC family, response regulator AtoC